MRETPRSLRAYFILVGAFSLVGSFMVFTSATQFTGPNLAMLTATGLKGLVGGAYLWIGIKLETLLRDKPHIPLRFATAAIILSALQLGLLGLLSAVGLLLNVYIWYQLRRMAREAAPQIESQVLE